MSEVALAHLSNIPTSNRFDALVVGAGLAGSTTAILLARAGWRIALVEKRHFPRRKVCGECLAASNLPLLHALGVGQHFEAIAGPELRRVTYMRRDDAIEALLPRSDHGPYPWGRALGRETLDELLLEQARALGVEIFQPFALLSINRGAHGWHCSLRAVRQAPDRTGQRQATIPDVELQAGEFIDAHGSWEPFPSPDLVPMAERPAPHRASDLLAFKANFRGGTFKRGHIGLLALDGGYGGIVEADNAVTTVACCVRRSRLDGLRASAPGMRAGDAVEAWIRASCAGVAQSLETAERQGPWLAAGPIQPGIRVDRGDGILRVGNAAGEAHPILGEGMSMALQGAALLAETLLESGHPMANKRSSARHRTVVQSQYAIAWRHAFAPRVRLAAIIAHASMRPASASLSARLLRTWPGALTHVARWGGKTTAVSMAAHPTPLLVSFHNQESE